MSAAQKQLQIDAQALMRQAEQVYGTKVKGLEILLEKPKPKKPAPKYVNDAVLPTHEIFATGDSWAYKDSTWLYLLNELNRITWGSVVDKEGNSKCDTCYDPWCKTAFCQYDSYYRFLRHGVWELYEGE